MLEKLEMTEEDRKKFMMLKNKVEQKKKDVLVTRNKNGKMKLVELNKSIIAE